MSDDDVVATQQPDETLRQYPITYRIDRHQPMLTREEVLSEAGRGACHAVVLTSIMRGSDGSCSQRVVSMDGKTGVSLPALELFKAWIMTAAMLGDDTSLDPDHRMYAREVFAAFMDIIKSQAESQDAPRLTVVP